MLRRPSLVTFTAASIAWTAARTTSGPIPSPSIRGRIGSSGTFRPPCAIKILCPTSGGRRTRASDGIRPSRPLVERGVLEVFRTDVPIERPQESVVLPVLHHLRGPSRDPGDREDRREQIRRDAEAVEHESGVEVDIRIDALGRELSHDRFLDRGRDSEVRGVALQIPELSRILFQHEGPWIIGLVDAVAEAEDFLLVAQRVHDVFFGGLWSPNLLDRAQGRLDRPSMQRTLQDGDCTDDRAV